MIQKPAKPFVWVEWRDPNALSATEVVNEDTIRRQFKEVNCLTPGWLYTESPLGVFVASEYVDDGDYRGGTTILRELIVKIHTHYPYRKVRYVPPSETRPADPDPLHPSVGAIIGPPGPKMAD